jgi:hypothetical protein
VLLLPIVLAGAARLAVFAAICGVIRLANVAHHPAELGQFAGILGRAISPEAVLAWIVYVAMEPYVRRHWPQTLIGF